MPVFLFFMKKIFFERCARSIAHEALARPLLDVDAHDGGQREGAGKEALVGELFFRADGLRAGLHMFRSIFRNFQLSNLWDGSLLNLGMSRADLFAVMAGCIVVAIVGSAKERGIRVRNSLEKKPVFIRWSIYYALILAVIVIAAYGDDYQVVDMIYAGF